MSRRRNRGDFVGSGVYMPFLQGAQPGMNQNPSVINTEIMRRMYMRVLGEMAMGRFSWHGLPEEIDPRFLEKTLYLQALAVFYKDEAYGKYFALRGTPNGSVNMIDNPTTFRVYGNQFVGKTLSAMPRTVKVMGRSIPMREECVPIWANASRVSDLDIVSIYATRLAEFDMTIEINGRNSRNPKIIAVEENAQLSAENINRQIEEGQMAIRIGQSALGLLPTVLDMGVDAKQIETLDVVRGRIWNTCMGLLGIDNSNQDKKERLVESEVDANNDQVARVRHANLKARRQAAHMINRRWGTNITVEYSDGNESANPEARNYNEEVVPDGNVHDSAE